MASPLLIKGSAYEDGGCSIMARITGTDGANIVQADVSAITLAVYDPTGTVITPAPTVVVATSVFNTLQTDSRWTADSTGYNFRYDVAATVMSSPGTYRYEFKFTPASGATYWVVAEVYANPITVT